jgi:hypothetical protein
LMASATWKFLSAFAPIADREDTVARVSGLVARPAISR